MPDQPTGQAGPAASEVSNQSAVLDDASRGQQPVTSSMLGTTLAPAVQRACDPHLSEIHFFRTDWQRGGAMTGYADFTDDTGTHPVVVKYPIPPRERRWLNRLQTDQHELGDIVPKVYASGDSINGYDFAWVVMERLTHGPLDTSWQGEEWDLLIQAAGRYYAAASQHPVDQPPRQEDWADIIKRARAKLREHGVAEEQRWNKALKALQKKLPQVLAAWDARDVDCWCHGDLHMANAMTRDEPPQGCALLFDFAAVHAGHWVEDAVYLEHLYWAAPDRLAGRAPVKMIAHQRKALGLAQDPEWPNIANLRRVLLAASVPAYLHQEGNPKHVHAALERLEQSFSQLHV